MFERQKFAPSHNNAANAKAFKELSPPLFADYERAIAQRWNGYAGKQLTGRRLDRTYGKPSVAITFGRLSRAEFAYLQTLVGYVTVYVLNEDANIWQYFNGVVRQFTAADFSKQGDAYVTVVLNIIDLEPLL